MRHYRSARAGLAVSFSLGLLAACGTPTETTSVPTTPLASVDAPVESTSPRPSSDGINPTEEEPCDAGRDLTPTVEIIQVRLRAFEEYTSRGGAIYSAITISETRSLAKRDVPLDFVADDIDLSLNNMLVSPVGRLAGPELVDALATQRTAVLFVFPGSIGNGQYRMLIAAAGLEMEDGSISLLTRCGAALEAAVRAAAGQLKATADADFWLKVARWDTPEAGLVGDLLLPRPTSWYDENPVTRSLDIHDIPVDARKDFKLVGINIVEDEGLPSGFVSLRCEGGVIRTFATANVSGVLPGMLPRSVETISVTFVDPDGKEVTLAPIDAELFQEDVGIRLHLRRAETASGVEVVATQLAQGDLERILGITSDDLAALRTSLLETS